MGDRPLVLFYPLPIAYNLRLGLLIGLLLERRLDRLQRSCFLIIGSISLFVSSGTL
jgi:hypothetical protein